MEKKSNEKKDVQQDLEEVSKERRNELKKILNNYDGSSIAMAIPPQKSAQLVNHLLHTTLSDDFIDALVSEISHAHSTALARFTDIPKKLCEKKISLDEKELLESITRLREANLNTDFEKMCYKLKKKT